MRVDGRSWPPRGRTWPAGADVGQHGRPVRAQVTWGAHKGKVPNKLIRAGLLGSQHFDDNLDFIYQTRDTFTKMEVVKVIQDLRVTRNLTDSLLERQPWYKTVSSKRDMMVKKMRQLADLLERCLAIDPAKRLTPDEALQHPFIRG